MKKCNLTKKEVKYLLDTAWMYNLFNINGITDRVVHKVNSKWIREKYEPILKNKLYKKE